MRTVLEVFI